MSNNPVTCRVCDAASTTDVAVCYQDDDGHPNYAHHGCIAELVRDHNVRLDRESTEHANTPRWTVGQKVRATEPIVEAGFRKNQPSHTHIHANFTDEGVVEYVNEDGMPTVRFQPSGTATIVEHSMIEAVSG